MSEKSKIEQLDLFKEDDQLDEKALLWEKYIELKRSHDKLRRRLFSDIDELKRQLTTIEAQNERLICLKEESVVEPRTELGWATL